MLSVLLLAAVLAAAPSVQHAPGSITPPPANPMFRRYGAIDGLPSGAVYTITQDRAGYIWIGSRDGLARFDAQDFRIFRHDPADPASLPANDISTLLADREGRLWAGGEGNGLNLYLPRTGGFRHWRHDPRDPASLSGDDVSSLAEGNDGSIWVGVYAGGLNRFIPGKSGFSHLRHHADDPSSLSSDIINTLAASADGSLWIGTDVGLDHLDARGHIEHVRLPGIDDPVTIWQARVNAQGVDAATDQGLFHIDTDGTVTHIGSTQRTFASLRTADGLWIAHQGGLDLLMPSGTVRHYLPRAGRPGSLPGALPLELLADREGGLWIALFDAGVAYLPQPWRAFDTWRHVPGDAGSLATDRVRALATSRDGTLWVGGARGMLDHLDPVAGAIHHFGGDAGLGALTVTALAEDRQGRLWIGHQRGLRVLDGVHPRGTVHEVGADMSMLRHGVIALLAASDGTVYFSGVGTGVARIEPRTLVVQPLRAAAPGSAAQQVTQLREAADGSIWSAGAVGLARLPLGADGFGFVPGIARGTVDAFAFGADDTLWVARGDRLQQFRLHAGTAHLLTTIGANHGWPAVDVRDLETDAGGRLWATTQRGLVSYNPATRRIRTYGTADGLADPEFTPRTLIRNRDGVLYAGSVGGVIGVRGQALRNRSSRLLKFTPATAGHR